VDKDTGEYLDDYAHNSDVGTEAKVGAHLLLEHRLEHRDRFVTEIPFVSKHLFNLGVFFPLEEVAVAVQVVLVGHIKDLNDLGPAHNWRVQLVILADGAEPGGAGGNKNESVEDIASNEVPASAIA